MTSVDIKGSISLNKKAWDCSSYFLVLGDQVGGISGSLLLAAKGVLGMTSDTLAIDFGRQPPGGPRPRSRRIVVGKFSEIYECHWVNRVQMKTIEECPNIKEFGHVPRMVVPRSEVAER